MIKAYLRLTDKSSENTIPERTYFIYPDIIPKQGEEIRVIGELYRVERVVLQFDEEEVKTVLELSEVNEC